MPKKVFVPGEVLRSADVNTYLTGTRNTVINSGFDVWQRNTNFTNLGNGAYTADRWAVQKDGTATINVSRQDFTPGSAPVAGYEGKNFLRFNVSAWTSSAVYLTHRIEDVRLFAGQNITISYWAKAAANITSTGYATQSFGAGGSGAVPVILSAANITTSWQRFTHTVAMPSITGKTVGANSFTEIQVIRFAAAETVDIWGVQVEEGSTATPYQRNGLNIQQELAACQRYYQKSYNADVFPGTASSVGAITFTATSVSSGQNQYTTAFNPRMRGSNPTVTVYSANNGAAGTLYDAGANANKNVVVENNGENGFGFYVSQTISGQGTWLRFQWAAESEL